MKIALTAGLLVILGAMVLADDTKPQPRPRLDPALREKVVVVAAEKSTPGRAAAGANSGGPILMGKFIVRDRRLVDVVPRRPALEDPRGRFTLLGGGAFRDVGPFSIGMWAHIDIMGADAVFHPPAKGPAFDFLRMKW